jgi:lipopolysaccharide transport system ATP-binding protein
MSNYAIRVENLGKKYRIGRYQGRYKSLRESITRVAAAPFRALVNARGSEAESTIWALKDVSFDIQHGEVVGIIGRNGAGKSTLLKLLARITEPTEGSIRMRGRVGSLLEVGTGFHPELTGRENIFLNGAILGMSRSEIQRKFDEIVEFAEIEKFIDTPAKHYSSGMYMRLAFAVAAHLEPEILLVDEVLAVGDAAFQKKCLGKMDEVARQGRTVLFVSHNMESILRLCMNGILFNGGMVVQNSSIEKVVNTYLVSGLGFTIEKIWNNHEQAPGNDIVRLNSVQLCLTDGEIKHNVDITKPVGIRMDYEVLSSGHVLNAAYNFYNSMGSNIFDSHDTSNHGQYIPKEKGMYCSTVWIPGNFFSEGAVFIGAAIVTPEPFQVHFHEQNVLSFNIVDYLSDLTVRGGYLGTFPGEIRPYMKWETTRFQ